MGKRVAGTSYFKVDGGQLSLEGGVECPLFDVIRESKEGAPGYYKEKDVIPYVKGTFIVPDDFPLDKLNNGINMTITTELANGKTYVLSGAYVVGEANYNSEEGTAEIRFEGVKGIWQ